MEWFNCCDTIDKRCRYPYNKRMTKEFARRALVNYLVSNKIPKGDTVIYVDGDEFYQTEYDYEYLNELAYGKDSLL